MLQRILSLLELSSLRSVYVDDISYGADDVDSAYELYKKSKETLAEGGFNLRKFVTNSVILSQRIQQNELEPSREGNTRSRDLLGRNHKSEDTEQKVLGIRWKFVQDELIFNINELAILLSRIEPPTKRKIVALTTKFYDPLGFISPLSFDLRYCFSQCVSRR